MRMHDGEAHIDAPLVRRLLAEQFPELAGLPVTEVVSTGTVNAIYRIGDDLAARLPRVAAWQSGLESEWRWLPHLAPKLSLAVPEPVGLGSATEYHPLSWAIYRWIDGTPYADDQVADERAAAQDLARFVWELHALDATGAPPAGRQPLHEVDEVTRAAIDEAGDLIDRDAVLAAWDRALEAPVWRGNPVWIHADLLRPNILVSAGRLRAVIDWGGAGAGDPATDVIAAWSVFNAPGRAAYRQALDVNDETWDRARGIALHQAALILPYYRETNPDFVALAQRTVDQVLTDAPS